MKVERIEVAAYGRLREWSSGPDPLGDLVVVLGPNEAGKTTLFHFLTTLLYGFHPAGRDSHPYAPWGGEVAAGSALLRLAGARWEVHRRLLSSPTGSLVRDGVAEELRNRPLPCVEHVPLATFRRLYAITLSELAGLEGESWAAVEDRLVAGLGAGDVRAPRVVADELESEAGTLWRPHRRGNQKLRQQRERLRDLERRRRDVAGADRTLRDKVRERERLQVELDALRGERDECEVYVERYRALLPIRSTLIRIRGLEEDAGAPGELAGLPADPAARSAELDARAGELEGRLAALADEAEGPRGRSGAAGGDDALLERAADVERLVARVHAAGADRARAGQLEQEVRDLDRRAEAQAGELLSAPWEGVDPAPLLALSLGELRERARALDRAARDRRVAEEAARRAPPAPTAQRAPGLALVVAGALLLALGLALGLSWPTLPAALMLGAGLVLLLPALRAAPGAPADPADPASERERAARAALAELLEGLPLRAERLGGAPLEVAAGCERLQELARDRKAREAERAELEARAAALAGEVAALGAACALDLPDDPAAAAHLLGAALAEAGRRRAAAEQARAELARLERAAEREEASLARVRADREALSARLAALGDGDPFEGLRRWRTRSEARAEAVRLRGDLERAHPDLEEIRVRIRRAEAAGEDWVVDEEALARRRLRARELEGRIEALAERAGALAQEIEQLGAGETLDRIDGEAAVLAEQIDRLERERDRKHVLARLLRVADRRYREEHQPELVRRAGEHLSAVTGGRWQRILLSDGPGERTFQLRGPDTPEPVPVALPLSTGTREQVYLALRLAALDQLDRGGERLPLFLDEALVNWDPARRERALDLLAGIARARQLFVFTCHPEHARALSARGARVLALEPPRP